MPSRMRKPTHLPGLQATNADAAWRAGWWSGKVTGFMLGLGAAVLIGWLK